ncbi:MAG: hypothetical protein IJU62_05760 [Muribaculaceae bacterium]|nr:hypothetical protein [Muribaculaceae bacterium]
MGSLELWSLIVEVATVAVAMGALFGAWREYVHHKKTDNNKLFSQLNERYQGNANIQAVVQYLREKEPSDVKPTLYQVEVFLRFFEELAMYIDSKSLDYGKTDEFFGYYFHERMLGCDRGNELLAPIRDEDWVRTLIECWESKKIN